MRPVSNCDPSTTILGFKSSIPVFVSGTALAGLGHPRGEANITRGAGHTGIIQMVSSNASLSPEEIVAARVSDSQPLFFQLYKSRVNDLAEKRVREVEALGYNAIFLTVDALIPGIRPRDVRAPFDLEDQEREADAAASHGQGTKIEMPMKPTYADESAAMLGSAGALLANMDLDMTWEKTIPWLRRLTKLPIVIKGIQCVAVSFFQNVHRCGD